MVSRRYARRLLPFVTIFVIIYVSFPHLYYFGDYIRQTNPFSGQRAIEQPFTTTIEEYACLRGRFGSFSLGGPSWKELPFLEDPKRFPGPNTVHFIYGLVNPHSDPSAGHFDFLSYLAVRAAFLSLQPTVLKLHYTYLSSPPSPDPNADPLSNPWIRRLKETWPTKFELVHHPPPSDAANDSKLKSKLQYAHMSDTLRLQILFDEGGIYLDTDVFALRPFSKILLHPPLDGKDVVLGYEGGNRWGLCNAVIVTRRPGAGFIKRWLDSYKNVDLKKEAWNYRSVRLPKMLAEERKFLDKDRDVCALPPHAFFWPTWTWRHVEWMHTELKTKREKEHLEGNIEKYGGLFKAQMAYHAWGQMAWDRYLKYLTPEVIRTKDTPFNLLMRRFVEDDL